MKGQERMDMDNLKKCPFCGGEARMITHNGLYYVECANDWKCIVPPRTFGRLNPKDAVNAWNHRAPEWIKFTEELEEVPEDDPEWGEPRWQFTCETPEDGQEILTARKTKYGFRIELDTFYEDEEGCTLESDASFEDDEIWWMPLPEPPQES